ncbi:MAG: SDR family NAD(P)-dependent oxidoreductase [Muribaculaceae bacterium]|nr:SDR family NAD(P)-dependent oxidoreductase [Muribaculaceae bacterium]
MKRIVIVGASSGLGLGAARKWAARGFRLGLAARRPEALERLAAEYPGQIEWAAIDITRPEAPGQLVELAEKLGGMDVYCHVAGIGYDNPAMDPEREAQMITTNTAALARMTAAAYSYFRDHGRDGQIAAVTSVAGTAGIGSMAAYSASKCGAQAYLTALAQLAREQGVRVCVTDVRPGWTRTPLLHAGKRYMMEMEPDYAVRRIVRAVDRRRSVAYVDWRWGALCRVWRLLPRCVWTRLKTNFYR